MKIVCLFACALLGMSCLGMHVTKLESSSAVESIKEPAASKEFHPDYCVCTTCLAGSAVLLERLDLQVQDIMHRHKRSNRQKSLPMPTVDEVVMLEQFAQKIKGIHDILKTRPKLPKEEKSKEYTIKVSKRRNTLPLPSQSNFLFPQEDSDEDITSLKDPKILNFRYLCEKVNSIHGAF